MTDTNVLPNPVGPEANIYIPMQRRYEPGRSITIRLNFRPIDELLLADFVGVTDAIQEILDAAVDEAQELVPLSDYVRPTVELTRIHFGSDLHGTYQIKNVRNQHYAITVTLIRIVLIAAVGLAGIAAKIHCDRTNAELQTKQLQYEYNLKKDEAEKRHSEYMAALALEEKYIESAYASSNSSPAKSPKPKQFVKKVSPSCQVLSGVPSAESNEKPTLNEAIVEDISVSNMPR